MVNDLKRRLKNLEGCAGSVITVTASAIGAAIERYRAAAERSALRADLPSPEAFGAMLGSMRPATAVQFLNIEPEDLLL